MTTKPFDLARAMANGGRCQTRDGRPARIICTDAKSDKPIVALIGDGCGEYTVSRFLTGFMVEAEESSYDLVNIPEKRSGWINVYDRGDDVDLAFHNTREEADRGAGLRRIACKPIEWEK